MKLACESVYFSYSGKQWIFENYSRLFSSGITILKGYSGCGKTTLLKLLAGYLKPQRGKVLAPGRRSLTDALYRRKEVSYMFQGINLLPLATVERNLQLCAEMAMLPKKQWTQEWTTSWSVWDWNPCVTRRRAACPADRPSVRLWPVR